MKKDTVARNPSFLLYFFPNYIPYTPIFFNERAKNITRRVRHFLSRYPILCRCMLPILSKTNSQKLHCSETIQLKIEIFIVLLYDTVSVSSSDFRLCKDVAFFMYTIRTDRKENTCLYLCSKGVICSLIQWTR